MRHEFILIISLLLLFSAAAAQSPPFVTSYSVFDDWLPIVMISMFASLTLVSAYYILGVLLNNNRVKSRALGELGQAIGTGIIIVGVILLLGFFGTGIFQQVSAINPQSLQNICTQLSGSRITFLQPQGQWGTSPTPTSFVCGEVKDIQQSPSVTSSIDYGLFANYLIIANVTNQTATNLNSLYLFEGWIGFASKFVAESTLCFPKSCLVQPLKITTELTATYTPLAGFGSLQTISQPVEVQGTLTFYVFFLELVFSILVMYLWPWFLAAGIILRTSQFTRRAGGLMIAMTIALLLIFPVIFTMEYAAFQNAGQSPGPIGASGVLPTQPIYQQSLSNGGITVYGTQANSGGYVPSAQAPSARCAVNSYAYEGACGYEPTDHEPTTPNGPNGECVSNPGSGQMCTLDSQGIVIPASISVNFFVLPSVGQLLNFNSCLPNNLQLDEGIFAGYYLIPFYGIGTGIFSGLLGLQGSLPTTPSSGASIPGYGGLQCSPSNAINSVLDLANLYGIVTVAAYLLPLLNLVIVISAAVGLSGLMGGDTNILGLSRLL